MRYEQESVYLEGPIGEADIADVWPKAEPLIAQALERDGFKETGETILDQLAHGLCGLYLVRDSQTDEIIASVICDSLEYANSSVFNIGYVAGRDLYRWANLLGALEQEAVRLGCDTVRITGRPGWGRVFPDYRETNRVYERKVVVQ